MMNKVGSAVNCAPARRACSYAATLTKPAVAQQLLPTVHLTGQCVAHPGDQGRFLGQVGDDRGHVRRRAQVEKCCATFEVDQQQVEHFWRVARHHAQCDGAQQLRLT